MAITFACGGCQQRYQVDDALAGRKIRCKKCGAVVSIPDTAAAPAPATPTAARPRPALQSFGGDPGARPRPAMQSFGTPSAAPRPAPQPEPTARPSFLDEDDEEPVEIGDDPAGPDGPADPYSLDEAYAPPKAPALDEEELPGPPRAGIAAPKSKKPRPPAGFWVRFAALLIDTLVMWVFSFAVGVVAGIVMFASGIDANAPGIQALLTLVGLALNLGYYASMNASSRQATLGKMALGLKVLGPGGDRLTFPRALGRELAKFLSGLFCLAGYIMAAFTDRKRALHDMIANTYVVHAR